MEVEPPLEVEPTLTMEPPLELEAGNCLGQAKRGQGGVKYGTGYGVGAYGVVDGNQLEKISRSLEMAKICLWWTEAGPYYMTNGRELSAWTMRSAGDTVGWVR